jgi:hypothetical protein
MQPTFIPWLGYFELIDYADTFIFLDTVQLNQQSWQTRNKLKITNQEHLFSLPIMKTDAKQNIRIKDALLDFRKYDFRKKLSKSIEQNYKKSKFFLDVNPFIQELIFYETDFLHEYTINIIENIAKKIGITTQMLQLSKIGYEQNLKKSHLILDLCEFMKTDIYISTIGSKAYLLGTEDIFGKKNIQLRYQYYIHPTYNQLGSNFIPYIGIFDLVFNEGFEESLKIIRSGRKYEDISF